MEIGFVKKESVGVISVSGRLDASNAEELKDKFRSHLRKTHNFVMDLSKLEFLDSTGLGAIVACLKYSSEKNGDVVIANLQSKPRMVFEITRAYKIFDVFDDVNTAIKAL
ncbi:MAG: STAS domain-containing protein [Candidatus Cloacimonetes bacterium]|nr:STAS domain-containing protein [Candidatus Cloacimonadota bacterium]